jgi:hypothetical protein
VAEKLTDGVEVIALVEKVGGEAMSKCMEAALLYEPNFFLAS